MGYFLDSAFVAKSTRDYSRESLLEINEKMGKFFKNLFLAPWRVLPTTLIYFLKISFVSPIKLVSIVALTSAVLSQSVSKAISPNELPALKRAISFLF